MEEIEKRILPMEEGKAGLQSVWTDKGAILLSVSRHETKIFSRETRQIKREIYILPPMVRLLSPQEFLELDGFLSSLCLEYVQGEPMPPPGQSASIQISGESGVKKIGWKGQTGGDFFLLPEDLRAELFRMLHRYSP